MSGMSSFFRTPAMLAVPKVVSSNIGGVTLYNTPINMLHVTMLDRNDIAEDHYTIEFHGIGVAWNYVYQGNRDEDYARILEKFA
jgi:hypothetical protein